MFCPPIATLLPLVTSTAAAIEVNGGAITMSQSVVSATSGRNSEKNARVSACVLHIFQFPAMTLLRVRVIIDRSAPQRRAVCVRQETPATRHHRWKYAKSCPLHPIGARPPQSRLRLQAKLRP